MLSLIDIAQQLTIYCGFFLLLTGVIGNSMSLLVFSTQRNYRRTPSSFLFLVGSINDLIYLLSILTTRILATGFGIDLFGSYAVFCKLRAYLTLTLGHISFTCYCLASINQFLLTSRQPKLRQLSSIKWTHRVSFILILIWLLNGIPQFVFTKIAPSTGLCSNTNPVYNDYTFIIFFVLLFGLPVLVLTVFGYLSYRNIHRIRALVNQQADRQLTRMTIIQAALICFSVVPYGIFNVYSFATFGAHKSIDRIMKEYLASAITYLIASVHFAGSFYVYVFSSKRFRERVKEQILFCKRNNDIHPIHAR